ncbi:hypothetical protein WA556_004215 [Blastocystis sp. ATCC 50177/Nand II]
MDILQTMCVKELWGAELQEKEAMLIREKARALMEAVGEREKVAVKVMGKMRDTGRMVVKDSKTGESLEVARKVTFNPAIRARTVTVEGDVLEPSGIVEGGSRRGGVPVLSLLSKANKVRGELDAKERELDASSRELSEMRKRAEKYRSAKSALELALHNLEVLEKAEGVAEVALVREVKEEYEKVKGGGALEACASERLRVEGVLKQNSVEKAKLGEGAGESVGEHKWLGWRERAAWWRLEEEQEQLGRRLNKSAQIIEKDKSQIEEAGREEGRRAGDDVREGEPATSGRIFSTLGVLEGLEVRVAFGGKEKESFLLALSLLLFKPAPMCILDEMERLVLCTSVGLSSFFLVCLKGMFTNANVLFRTKVRG